MTYQRHVMPNSCHLPLRSLITDCWKKFSNKNQSYNYYNIFKVGRMQTKKYINHENVHKVHHRLVQWQCLTYLRSYGYKQQSGYMRESDVTIKQLHNYENMFKIGRMQNKMYINHENILKVHNRQIQWQCLTCLRSYVYEQQSG